MRALLLISFGLLVYIYAGYPVLCALLARMRRHLVLATPATPRVSILIAAHNEVSHIAATIHNKLALDYPPDRCEIIVVSDGSDDGTDAAVATIATSNSRVRFIRQDPRSGKTAALNRAVAVARGEILVFSDANSLYAPDALRRLVAPFSDQDVGYSTGRMFYIASDGSLTGEGCSAYMRYENRLRTLESAIGSVVGVQGGIDAVRAELYTVMRPDQQPDFILPLSVVERGRRVVFASDARLYEASLTSPVDEFRMRARVSLRAWHALRDKATLLNPLRYGLFSVQLLSHKWLRYLAPVFQICALICNAALLGQSSYFDMMFIAQVLFYLLAGAGFLGWPMPTPLSFPYYLCLLNAAAGVALFRFLCGHKQVTWRPRT